MKTREKTNDKTEKVCQRIVYDSSFRPLPDEYCQLIQERFNLTEDDRIIDLGCGSGLLTFVLSRFSNHVEGIDISKNMIEIARSRDTKKRIRWLRSSVEDFYFGHSRYSLIIAYESFHLFSDIDRLIQKCEKGLRQHGFLCIGWCQYEWEEVLKDIIIDVFGSIGIEWGEWGYQKCPGFSDAVERYGKSLSPVVKEMIKVQRKSHIQNIAQYLASIDKSATLKTNKRMKLIAELENKFKRFLSSEWVSGLAFYSLTYSRKYIL